MKRASPSLTANDHLLPFPLLKIFFTCRHIIASALSLATISQCKKVRSVIKMDFASVVGVYILLSGCTTISDIPKNAALGEDYAEITYEKGYENSGLGNASNQFYSKAYDDTCASVSGGAKFYSLTGRKETVLFKVNKRTIIYAMTNNIQYDGPALVNGVQLAQRSCANKIAFTPKANHRYTIIQRRQNAGACVLEVADDNSEDPLDYEVLEYRACTK